MSGPRIARGHSSDLIEVICSHSCMLFTNKKPSCHTVSIGQLNPSNALGSASVTSGLVDTIQRSIDQTELMQVGERTYNVS